MASPNNQRRKVSKYEVIEIDSKDEIEEDAVKQYYGRTKDCILTFEKRYGEITGKVYHIKDSLTVFIADEKIIGSENIIYDK
jgi:hypothetical protein